MARPPSRSPEDFPKGVELLHDPVRNKGTAFTPEERQALGLRGLLPPRPTTQDQQVLRVMENLRRKSNDLERYIFLVALQDRNETLFYRVLVEHLEQLMPIVYTPTVGEACQMYGHIFRRSRGLYVSSEDRGSVREVIANWPHDDVRIVVVTDGERILGLGDLGAAGMGIPVGKLVLYTACAGIHPTKCLPVTLDVGTNNEAFLEDPLYLGLPRHRLRGAPFLELVDELIEALVERFPRAIIQFEDFATRNAFALLERYRERHCFFNDDIQGTGSVALAGLLSALRITGGALSEQRLLFLGAGEAAIGIADTVVAAMVREGLDEAEARRRCWFFDTTGLVVGSREGLAPHKLRYAHEAPQRKTCVEAVRELRPTALIGASGAPGAFDREVLEAMAELNERPIVFALSNPTSRSECTAAEDYGWTGGRAIFASGSPFDPVDRAGRRFVPSQANNAYVFPGVGLGALVAEARHVTDEMFAAAARTLAVQVTEDDLRLGRLFPPLSSIREVSVRIAAAVARAAAEAGLARRPLPDPLEEHVRAHMFEPHYEPYA